MANLFRLFKQVAGLIPTPVLIAIIAALIVFGGPLWLENARLKEIRGLVRQVSRAGGEGPDADRLAEKAIALAGTKANRLELLGREAHRRQLVRLRDQAWTALDRVDAAAGARARKDTAAVARPGDRHALEALVAAEQLLANGATEAARARVEKGLARFPDDPDLLALRDRLGPVAAPAPEEK